MQHHAHIVQQTRGGLIVQLVRDGSFSGIVHRKTPPAIGLLEAAVVLRELPRDARVERRVAVDGGREGFV